LPEFVDETKPGEKKVLKSLDHPLYKAYIPQVVEASWMAWWKKEGFFEPKFGPDGKVSKEGYFVIPIPPPNVTGALHWYVAFYGIILSSHSNQVQGAL
jgi:valyl-tRNA synthetase